MSSDKKIHSALVSAYNKVGLVPLCKQLKADGVTIYSTGGTKAYLEEHEIDVTAVEDITEYPAILGGRVKTLHPAVFGGILNRDENSTDQQEVQQYSIPNIDLVIVDLYPFEQTLADGASHEDIIEKIDIGGIALLRAAAKNYEDTLVISSVHQYDTLLELLKDPTGTSVEQRKEMATHAFRVTAGYDRAINNYFSGESGFSIDFQPQKTLRYGENPHQKGSFYGNLGSIFDQLHGKEISYNNLLDIDAAYNLMADFKDLLPTFAILKHNNACGLATRETMSEAYSAALEGDPVSAFGGILIANSKIDQPTAEKINQLFCEVVIAPSLDDEALNILKSKKNRVLLILKNWEFTEFSFRSALNGVLVQDRDEKVESHEDLQTATKTNPSQSQITDLLFANKLVKHTKSNTIVLAKDQQLLASGTGQTSRVDALKQAINKARAFNLELDGAVMASDAFFPFPDCVEIAHEAGIKAVVQPGGSKKDQASIDFCDEKDLAMVMTGIRHFKH